MNDRQLGLRTDARRRTLTPSLALITHTATTADVLGRGEDPATEPPDNVLRDADSRPALRGRRPLFCAVEHGRRARNPDAKLALRWSPLEDLCNHLLHQSSCDQLNWAGYAQLSPMLVA
eukprot:CAMPEP_0194490912 /NCGR_PEP_ID=MMETSP0253-20130528/9964_1 /TAXON_ID=2966 /ORGANISM="Noctiluca scintillans" /LENGTH=118 /DNA_ID=CAMNT_0039331593 /DNA_START=229 /DNA_END=587 /DNA_ORIENTATION=+